MRVIGVGLVRTGTASIQAGLNRLGFGPCYHGFELFREAEVADRWLRLDSGEPVPWDQLFAGYRSCLDLPPTAYWRELVDAYPDAKVLLSVRDPHRWYDSLVETIFPMIYRHSSSTGVAKALDAEEIPPQLVALGPMLGRYLTGLFGKEQPDRDTVVDIFERHIREVRAHVAADRLLVFDVKQRWEPLCGFLGVPVPDEEFPHLNDTTAFLTARNANFTEAPTTVDGGKPCA